MPPLRERREDVAPLVEALLVRSVEREPPRLEPQALRALEAYSFPGNVRELENILERATALCNDNAVVLDDLQLAPRAVVTGDSVGRDG
jgi:two-component system response regulator PilR (NtrC family)